MTLPKVGTTPRDDENTREDIFYEIEILSRVQHAHVMNLKEYFEEDDKVYLITELLTGGELLDAVIDRGSYTEEDARQVRGPVFAKAISHLNGILQFVFCRTRQFDTHHASCMTFKKGEYSLNGMAFTWPFAQSQ
eukprot:scaffold178847_cov28-Prasinocladus_malaysianus.AAC.1